MIVEDDEDERFFIRTAFEASGSFVALADFECGEPLILWLNNEPSPGPDLILSDLIMQGINRFDLLSILKSDARWTVVPVIITSTISTASIINKCFALGASHYVIKPESFIHDDEYVRNFPFGLSPGATG